METTIIQMTKTGKPYTVTFDPLKPKKCSGYDENGQFGCGKTIFIANYPKGAGYIGAVPIIKEKSGLFGEERWINHYMNCEYADRFHALMKKLNEDKNRRTNIQ